MNDKKVAHRYELRYALCQGVKQEESVRFIVLFAATLVMSPLGYGLSPKRPVQQECAIEITSAPHRTLAEATAWYQLTNTLTMVDFGDRPLKDVISWLSKVSKVQFLTEEFSFEEYGESTDKPAFLQLHRKLSVAEIIQILCTQYHFAFYVSDDGIATVTMNSKLHEETPPTRAVARTWMQLMKLIDVDFPETPIKEALSYVEDVVSQGWTGAGLTVLYDEDAIFSYGLSKDAPVTLRLRKVPAYGILKRSLNPLGLDFRVDIQTGVVWIVPKT